MKNLINDGNPTSAWHGITHAGLLRRCVDATPGESAAMSTAASLMLAGDCTHAEWDAAERALHAVESRICAAWEREHGEPRRNRHGQIAGGVHPALRARFIGVVDAETDGR